MKSYTVSLKLLIVFVITLAMSNDGQCEVSKPSIATASQKLIQLTESPNKKRLGNFKKTCTSSSTIDFDGNSQISELLNKIIQKPNLIIVRAIVFAAVHCADGASAESVHGWLGNELLLQNASMLIRAIQIEDAGEKLKSIAELENADWFAVECKDEKCKKDKKAYFSKKRTTLLSANIGVKYNPTRELLLKNLKSDL